MAITQALLAEEILSRQERAVVRGIHRANCLADALQSLDKTYNACVNTDMAKNQADFTMQYNLLRNYLVKAIQNALVSTKAPASVNVVKEIPSPT